MGKIKLLLSIWGAICLVLVAVSWSSYPSISAAKLSTTEAITNLERNVNFNSMSKEQLSGFEFNKNWIISHSKAIEDSAKQRQIYLSIIGIFTSLICFIGSYYLPAYNK